MLLRKAILGAGLALVLGGLQGCVRASAEDPSPSAKPTLNLAALQQDIDDARKFDYCVWAYDQGGKTQALPDYGTLVDRKTTTLSPEVWSATMVVDAGTRISQASKSKKTCIKTFSKGTKSFNKKMKASLASHWKKAKYEKMKDPSIASVQENLAKHWVADQAARRVYIASRTEDKVGTDHWIRTLALAETSQADTNSTEFMRAVLNDYDWIDINRFGERVSMAAWLMVQHADDYVEFQSLALSRMEPYLESGGVRKGDYAFLWDRVAINSGKKQRYGTQPTWECTPEGKLTLQPMEDPDNVNQRRKDMAMDTVETGLAKMAKSVCG